MAACEVTWGDEIHISETAPQEYHPGERGSVCGFWGEGASLRYTVEFGDGSSAEIPAEYAEVPQRAAA